GDGPTAVVAGPPGRVRSAGPGGGGLLSRLPWPGAGGAGRPDPGGAVHLAAVRPDAPRPGADLHHRLAGGRPARRLLDDPLALGPHSPPCPAQRLDVRRGEVRRANEPGPHRTVRRPAPTAVARACGERRRAPAVPALLPGPNALAAARRRR